MHCWSAAYMRESHRPHAWKPPSTASTVDPSYAVVHSPLSNCLPSSLPSSNKIKTMSTGAEIGVGWVMGTSVITIADRDQYWDATSWDRGGRRSSESVLVVSGDWFWSFNNGSSGRKKKTTLFVFVFVLILFFSISFAEIMTRGTWLI
jgi:hypothetical protein